MVEFKPALKALTKENVDFVVVDGLAISAHSSGYITTVLDFRYLRTRENMKKIVEALAPFAPRFRGFPEELPFVWDERTLQSGTNFTLVTSIGDIDLLGEVAGIGDFEAVKKDSVVDTLYGCEVRILTIKGLIKVKRAAGRTKDLLVLPELEALQELLAETEEEENK